jgi:protein-disulfide isomerase
MHKPMIAGLAALPLLLAGAYAVQRGSPGRAETEEIVRDYLLQNPEVVIEAIERYQAREAIAGEARVQDAAQAWLPRLSAGEAGVALGAPMAEAEVVVVEFFDYHCGYCRRAAEMMLGLAEEEGVRVVFQDLPILREESTTAALAGLAAAEAGDYARVHAELMRTKGVLDEAAVTRAAKRAGASRATLAAIASPPEALEGKLAASREAAEAFGVQGTPAFIVASPDGAQVRFVPGYAPEAVREAIEAVRG